MISDERLKLVRKWIRNDSVAMMLAIGAIRPAASRAIWQPHLEGQCPKCHVGKADWAHFWECWLGRRRFMWPRDRSDLVICDEFKRWTCLLLDEHNEARRVVHEDAQ